MPGAFRSVELDQGLKMTADFRESRTWREECAGELLGIPRLIQLERLQGQITLVPERVVDTLATDPEVFLQIRDGCAVVALASEEPGRCLERGNILSS